MTATFGDRVRTGTRQVAVLQVASQIVSIVSLAFLFRRLGPEPFGLIGMLLPFLQLARMTSAFGIHVAVVQDAELNHVTRSAAFWLNQLTGAAAAVALIACGGVLSLVTGVAAVVPVSMVLSLTMVIGALGNVHQGLWDRELRVAELARIRLAAQIGGSLGAVVLALGGAGVWALVGQQLLEWTCLSGLLWWKTPWRPVWVGWESMRKLAAFGGWFTGANIGFYFGQNVDKLLLAGLLGGTTTGRVVLGLYSQSYNLVTRPVLVVTAPLYSMLLPALARARRVPGTASRLVGSFFRLAGRVLFPGACGMMLVADDLMLVLGGRQWEDAGRLLALMAPLIAVQGISNLCGSVLSAYGRARALFAASVAQVVVLGAGALSVFAFSAWSDHGASVAACRMALAMTLLQVVLIAPVYWLATCRLARLDRGSVFPSLLPVLFDAAAMSAAVWLARVTLFVHAGPAARLVGSAVLGVAVILLLNWGAVRTACRELRRSRSDGGESDD